jgi:hypothetical protein
MSPSKAHDYNSHAKVRDEMLKHRDPEKLNYPAVSVGDEVRILQKVPKGTRRFDHQDWSKTKHSVDAIENVDGTSHYIVADMPRTRKWLLRHEIFKA